jgi:hypothetical protein
MEVRLKKHFSVLENRNFDGCGPILLDTDPITENTGSDYGSGLKIATFPRFAVHE